MDLDDSERSIKVKREDLKESREALDASAEALEESKQCRICFERDVDSALSPCGHTICNKCAGSLSRCPHCRALVTKVRPLIFA